MENFQIKRWDNKKVIFEGVYEFLKDCVDEAVKQCVCLNYANLVRANLSYTNLSHANLSYAILAHANLEDANLEDANLSHANLAHANLSHANLAHANLGHTNLENASLVRANLENANLSYANLEEASLGRAKIKGKISHAFGGESNRLTIYNIESNMVFCGCFKGSLEKFEQAVLEKYKDLKNTDYKFLIEKFKWEREKILSNNKKN